MADVELPSSWSNAGRSALGNSLWILPLVAVERFFEGHLDQTAIAGAAWLVALIVSVKLHVLQYVISNPERRRQLLTWALILGGAAILGFGIARLAVEPRASVSQTELDAARAQVRTERDAKAALQDQLAVARKELQDTKTVLEAVKAAQGQSPSPPSVPQHPEYRRLSTEQTRVLVSEFAKLKSEIPTIFIVRSNDVRGEANQYARDFVEAFERAGVGVEYGSQSPAGPEQTGVMISVADPNSPPVLAVRLVAALDKASIASRIIQSVGNPPRGFILFIGPNPL